MTSHELTASFFSTLVSGVLILVPGLTLLARWIGGRLTRATDAYAEERAKLAAQFHNLDKLIEQTKALTATTESIKNELSGETWLKQQRWQKRVDAYVTVVDALQRYQNATAHVEVWAKNLQTDENVASEVKLHVQQQFGVAMDAYNLATDLYSHSFNLASLTCASEAVRVLRRFALVSFDLNDAPEKMIEARSRTIKTLQHFIAAARRDIGYEVLTIVAVPTQPQS